MPRNQQAFPITTFDAVTLTSTTASSSATTGALIVPGGVGIGGNLNVTGSIIGGSIAYASTSTGSITITDSPGTTLTVNSNEPANSVGTGCAVFQGGISCYGNLHVGGTLYAGSVTYTSTASGTFTVTNTPGQTFIVDSTEDSTSQTTGAAKFAGGIGVAKRINSGSLIANDTTQATTTTTGAIQSKGGIAAAGNAIVGGDVQGQNLISTATTPSTSTITGAIVTPGGLGVGGDIHCGNINATNATVSVFTGTGTSTFTGLTVSGDSTFNGVTVNGSSTFTGVTVTGESTFSGVTINGDSGTTLLTVQGQSVFNGLTATGNSTMNGITMQSGSAITGAANISASAITAGSVLNASVINGGSLMTIQLGGGSGNVTYSSAGNITTPGSVSTNAVSVGGNDVITTSGGDTVVNSNIFQLAGTPVIQDEGLGPKVNASEFQLEGSTFVSGAPGAIVMNPNTLQVGGVQIATETAGDVTLDVNTVKVGGTTIATESGGEVTTSASTYQITGQEFASKPGAKLILNADEYKLTNATFCVDEGAGVKFNGSEYQVNGVNFAFYSGGVALDSSVYKINGTNVIGASPTVTTFGRGGATTNSILGATTTNGDLTCSSVLRGASVVSDTTVNATTSITAGTTLNSVGSAAIGGFDVALGFTDQVTRGNSGSSRALVKDAVAGPTPVLVINYEKDFSAVHVNSDVNIVKSSGSNLNLSFEGLRALKKDSASNVLNVNEFGDFSRTSVYNDLEHRGNVIFNNPAAGLTNAIRMGSGTTPPIVLRGDLNTSRLVVNGDSSYGETRVYNDLVATGNFTAANYYTDGGGWVLIPTFVGFGTPSVEIHSFETSIEYFGSTFVMSGYYDVTNTSSYQYRVSISGVSKQIFPLEYVQGRYLAQDLTAGTLSYFGTCVCRRTGTGPYTYEIDFKTEGVNSSNWGSNRFTSTDGRWKFSWSITGLV